MGGKAGGRHDGGPEPGRERDVQRFRATLQAYFLPISIVTLALIALVGHVTTDVLTLSAFSFPLMVIGVLLGARSRRHISPELFRRFVVALLVAMSLMLISFALLGVG